MQKLGNKKKYWQVSQDRVELQRIRKKSNLVTLLTSPRKITFDLQHTAIIIIDMQNDFCSKGGWLDYIGVENQVLQNPVSKLNALLPELRKADVPVIWVNWGNREDRLNLSPSVLHVYNATGEGVGIGEPLPNNGSHVLEKGSWGASIIDGLQVESSDIHVDKYRMSGFWDTPLDSILRNLAVDTVLFAGVNVDQCVMATLQDSVCLGYDGILLEDCCATTSPAYCFEATLYNVKQCYGFVAASSVLLEAINAQVGEEKINEHTRVDSRSF
jgi:ureidoacrylate peracid hydrolase